MAVDVAAETPANGAPLEKSEASQSQEKPSNGAPRKPRPKRPNYHEIHSKPLPLDVYPLPVFIPHNPLSIVKIAISLISHSLSRPKSHTKIHRAYFSTETQSVHVTDPASIRALWEQGFWGKGSLSRSEPQWFIAEKRKRGAEAEKTSAEVTQSRREERKQFKLERAKAQREAIEQQLRQEGKLDADGSIEELVEGGQVSESPRGTIYTPGAGDAITVDGKSILSEVDQSLAKNAPTWGLSLDDEAEEVELKDLEHLQLTSEEAFFLTYVLGVLDIAHVSDTNIEESKPYPSWFLMRLYCAHASSPVSEDSVAVLRKAYISYQQKAQIAPEIKSQLGLQPDNAFLLRYVVFHHFRSLGWVVRSGVKFAVDYLLYLRGPAFSHAEFGIMIIPSYSHLAWSNNPELSAMAKLKNKEQKDWWWLHRVNRVQTQAIKTLLLVYVEVPPPSELSFTRDGLDFDIAAVLKKYRVREFVIRRWSPSRNRD